jgi:hypothetical protein
MSSKAQASLPVILETSVALCQRFAASLSPNASFEAPQSKSAEPSPLALLHASATTLKAQVTKLSLLAITAPFTPSAVATCLSPLNDSILTSLVTAALLTTPEVFTPSFSAACRNQATAALLELKSLLELVQARSCSPNSAAELKEVDKKAFTEATGKVWDNCDKLFPLAAEGVPGFVVSQSKQWLDLMKDAVKELQEWDPEDDLVFGDDLLGTDGSDDDAFDGPANQDPSDDRAAISAGVKEQALKVLNRIPQSIHVVIKQRLEKLPASTSSNPTVVAKLDNVLKRTRTISELIDESAEGMYLGDLELCLKKAGEARATTIEVVESVLQPWIDATSPPITAAPTDSNEDKYIQRALEWIRQVDPGTAPKSPS